jgi:hypothetical protein
VIFYWENINMKKLLSISALLLLTACSVKPAWQHYDECMQEMDNFIEYTACGKERRNTHCQTNNSCSAGGNAIIKYADSLSKSVKSGEISETEAERMWIEFRNKEEGIYRHERRKMIDSINSSAPTTTHCNTIGTQTFCNSF